MPKKLLMNNYSENGMLPIMDGLVCWLDGRDCEGTNSVKDRVGGKVFTCINITNNEHSFLYNKSDSTIFAEFDVNEPMYNLFNSDFTLCFEDKLSRPVSGSSWNYPSGYPRLIHFGYFSGDSPYQLAYNGEHNYVKKEYMYFNGSRVLYGTHVCTDLSKKSIVVVKKGNSVSVYLNGKRYETIDDKKDIVMNLERLTLGNTYLANRTYYGNLYSFKAYNRALSAEEIQRNYSYEQLIERG